MTLSCAPLTDREQAKTGPHHSRNRRQQRTKQKSQLYPWSLTFPDRLKVLAERFYKQALSHPAFVLMSPSEIRQSIENRLWSLAATQPIWWGSGRAEKREATPEQIKALEKARQRKIEIQLEADRPYVPDGLDHRSE